MKKMIRKIIIGDVYTNTFSEFPEYCYCFLNYNNDLASVGATWPGYFFSVKELLPIGQNEFSDQRKILASFFDCVISKPRWPISFKTAEDCVEFINTCIDLGYIG